MGSPSAATTTSSGEWSPPWLEQAKKEREAREAKAEARTFVPPDTPVPDFVTFRRECFGHETVPHQMEWIEALRVTGLPLTSDTKDWDGVINHCRLLVLEPPEHGKTSFSEDLLIWLICLKRELKSLFISKNGDVATQRLYRIRNALGDDPGYYERAGLRSVVDSWGPFKPSRSSSRAWGDTGIYVLGSSAADRNPTIEARGLRQQIQGARADVAILDDVFIPENQYSELERTRQMTWFGQTMLSRLPAKGGLVLVVGTRAIPTDNYRTLMEGGVFQVIEQPAILDEDKGEVLWPERWPLEDLQRKREEVVATSGEASWLLTYQQQATGLDDQPFKSEDLDAAKVLEPDYVFGTKLDGHTVVMGYDPAVAGRAAICVLGVDRKTGIRTIMDCPTKVNMGSNDAIKQFLFEACEMYKPAEVHIDATSWQTGVFADRDVGTFFASHGIRKVVTDIQGKMKLHPEVGVTKVASRFEAGQYRIPWNVNTRPIFGPLLDELQVWRPVLGRAKKPQDRVMALWLAERAAMKVMERGSEKPLPVDPGVPLYLRRNPYENTRPGAPKKEAS